MFDRVDIWLLITIFLPAIGAGLVWVLGGSSQSAVRQSALVTTLLTLLVSIVLIAKYPVGADDFGLYEFAWLGEASSIDVRFSIGLDGLSLWLFGLAALLSVTAVLVSWNTVQERTAGFYALLLLLETGMLGVFAARDIILFYIFFEFTLIPMFFLIGIWGTEDRRFAAMKFFLFTLAGSLLTFLGLLAIVLWHHSATGAMTFSIPELTNYFSVAENRIPNDSASHYLQMWIFLALLAGFAVKLPLFPFHSLLPLAYGQGPTGFVLSGVLLKIGAYGFVRFSVPLLPDAAAMAMPYVLWLSVIGIVYGALVALAQSDIKRLVAYSSVSHLGFVMLGIFSLTRLGMQGSVLQMVNHGVSTAGLFAVIGMVVDRYHTRQIRDLSGLTRTAPVLALFMLLFTFSSIGLPGMNSFVGEFLLLAGMFQRARTGAPVELESQLMWIAVLAVIGVLLGAWYMLWLIQRMFFGPLRTPTHPHASSGEHAYDRRVHDLSFREIAALLPLVGLVFWIGIYPQYFLERIAPAVDPLTQTASQSFEQLHSGSLEARAIGAGADTIAVVNQSLEP